MKVSLNIFFIVSFSCYLMSCYRGKPSEDTPIHLNPNMDSQAKYEAQEESRFFTDKSSMRMPVHGTVARGELREDDAYFRGKVGDAKLLSGIPIDVSIDLLRRGKERYNIYCAPCHGLTGSGEGIIIKKGFLPPPSFHIDRLREVQDGHFFEVISNGIRNMPGYNHQIPVKDRWAIVAYLRALQRSQNAGLSDIPEEKRDQLK
jgi:mono/diheme cytochrome c family protein